MKDFDKTEQYETEIAPLVKTIEGKCRKAHIPCFFTAAVAETEGHTEYATMALAPYPIGVHLTDERITKHINVVNGFETVMPESMPQIDFEVE